MIVLEQTEASVVFSCRLRKVTVVESYHVLTPASFVKAKNAKEVLGKIYKTTFLFGV